MTVIPGKGLWVNKPDKLVGSCAKALRRALDNNNIFPKDPEVTSSSEMKYGFQDTSRGKKARESLDEMPVSVVPLEKSEVPEAWLPQWLAVNLLFEQSGKTTYLTQANLSVFSGISSDDLKRLRFRAEWRMKEVAAPHAQPHWHFHDPLLGTAPDLRPPGGGFESFRASVRPSFLSSSKDPSSEGKDDVFTRVHYAMASGWHKGGQASVENLKEEMIWRWLEGCVCYIREQVQYLLKKA